MENKNKINPDYINLSIVISRLQLINISKSIINNFLDILN